MQDKLDKLNASENMNSNVGSNRSNDNINTTTTYYNR